MSHNLYLDANATWPVPKGHYARVAEILAQSDGNPSSIHRQGRVAKVALEEARSDLANLLGVRPEPILFTSGATESNNIVLQGFAQRYTSEHRSLPRYLISTTEHSAVRDTAILLSERRLIELDWLPVNQDGTIKPEALEEGLSHRPALLAVMHANNETGVVHPIRAIADQIKDESPETHFHVDAVQSLGRLDLSSLGTTTIQSVALSGHKIGAFKGIGALYLRPGNPLALFMAGGGQERNRRPGTENMPGIISFGLRCRDLLKGAGPDVASLERSKSHLLDRLADLPNFTLHGDPSITLSNTINFHLDGVAGDDLLLNLDLAQIAAASGSACSSSVARPSHVLQAMGYSEWVGLNSIRLSWAEAIPEPQLDRLFEIFRTVVNRSRKAHC